jgi:hypothetical protein
VSESDGTSHAISVIDQHPLPTTVEEAEEVVRINPQFEGVDDAPHPDTFHERYQNVLGENNEWRIFRVGMYPYSNTVFVWNHQLGFGLRVPDDEWQFRSLVEAMMRAAEEVA